MKYDREFAIDSSRYKGSEQRESEQECHGVQVNPLDYQRKPTVEWITTRVLVRPVLRRKRPRR